LNRDTAVLIFSYNRPLQLSLTLDSLAARCTDLEDQASVFVLYKVSDGRYMSAYERLMSEHQKVNYIQEENFRADVLGLLKNRKYILFCVDDTVFTNDFSIFEMINCLNKNPSVLGFSLRLGFNTINCYPLNRKQSFPQLEQYSGGKWMTFQWTLSDGDYGYPLELSSSLYRTEDIVPIIDNFDFSGPNQLETLLSWQAGRYTILRSKLMMYCISRAFSIPLNKVQDVAKDNRYSEQEKYSSENLLRLYNEGLRIDPNKFKEFVSNGAHQEYELF
jgi:hypothetical protein